MSLPTDGWEGDVIPPVDLASLIERTNDSHLFWYQRLAKGALTFIAPDVQAAPKINVTKLREILRSFKNVPKENLVKSIKNIRRGMRNLKDDIPGYAGSLKVYRSLAHSKKLALAATVLSANVIKNLYRKADNLRINPITIIAAVAYLESRRECDDTDGAICKPLATKIADERLDGLYGSSFTKALSIDNNYDGINQINGNIFHVVMLARMHLEHELGAGIAGGLPVMDIEHKLTPIVANVFDYQHRIDIVLGELPAKGSNSTIMEVKSYQRGKGTKSSIEKQMGYWKIGSAIYKPHRQFIIDRVAKGKESGFLVKDVIWLFQTFRRKSTANNKANWSYSGTHIQKVRDALMRYPKPKSKARKALGYFEASASGQNNLEKIYFGSNIQLNDLRYWVLTTGKQYFLNGLSEDVIKFQNEYHN